MVNKRYTEDYENIDEVDETGRESRKTVYRGKYYEVELGEEKLILLKKFSSAILALLWLNHVAGGFVANRGMYQFYIALPYVLAFLPLFYMGLGILRLPTEKRLYRRDEIGLSFERARKSGTAAFILFVLGVVGEVIFMVFFVDRAALPLEFLYLATASVSAIGGFFFVRRYKAVQINEQEA
ncbi:MAG: hypothetical protein JW987_04820 [Anaerolineaceae bacterium]|nr:hypothetical protein [Anaerolineaceae bacterium]